MYVCYSNILSDEAELFYHPEVDYIPITARLQVFYSSYTTAQLHILLKNYTLDFLSIYGYILCCGTSVKHVSSCSHFKLIS